MAKKNPKVNVALTRAGWQKIQDAMLKAGIVVQVFGEEVDELFRQLREHDEARSNLGRNNSAEKPPPFFGKCEVCEAELMSPGGYGGTGMCGPCTTGEADTIGE